MTSPNGSIKVSIDKMMDCKRRNTFFNKAVDSKAKTSVTNLRNNSFNNLIEDIRKEIIAEKKARYR